MNFQKIVDIFKNNDNFTILTHKSPDGDTLGSGFALWHFLKNMGKKANVLNSMQATVAKYHRSQKTKTKKLPLSFKTVVLKE